jgi:hypothetical protein
MSKAKTGSGVLENLTVVIAQLHADGTPPAVPVIRS